MRMQAGTMLHPAAEPRNAPNTTPNRVAGRRGLTCSLASGLALSPSTTWVPPSCRLITHLDQSLPICHIPTNTVNQDSTKSGQHHRARRGTSCVPVVVLTDIQDARERERCLSLGAVAHMLKPTRLDEAERLIHELKSFVPS